MRTLILLVFLAVPASCATWDQLPLVMLPNRGKELTIEKRCGHLFPWESGMPLPTNYAEAKLTELVQLVDCGSYDDGGSQYYLFRGANGRCPLFCTDTEVQWKSKGSETIQPKKPRLFLGVAHYSDYARVVVPCDSPCEHFLLRAIRVEVERLRKKGFDIYGGRTSCERRAARPRQLAHPSRHRPARQISETFGTKNHRYEI